MKYVEDGDVVTYEVSLQKPLLSAVDGEIRKVTHSCTNEDAPLQDQAC